MISILVRLVSAGLGEEWLKDDEGEVADGEVVVDRPVDARDLMQFSA